MCLRFPALPWEFCQRATLETKVKKRWNSGLCYLQAFTDGNLIKILNLKLKFKMKKVKTKITRRNHCNITHQFQINISTIQTFPTVSILHPVMMKNPDVSITRSTAVILYSVLAWGRQILFQLLLLFALMLSSSFSPLNAHTHT